LAASKTGRVHAVLAPPLRRRSLATIQGRDRNQSAFDRGGIVSEKSKKRKIANVVPMRTGESPSPGTNETSPEETGGDIARRAFELYCERGCHDGHDVEDWLQAERDLRRPVNSTAA
jgi:hypothetical protein